MPTVPNDRVPVNFRTSPVAIRRLNDRARTEGFLMPDGRPNRSEMVRIMLAYADRTMPNGWRP